MFEVEGDGFRVDASCLGRDCGFGSNFGFSDVVAEAVEVVGVGATEYRASLFALSLTIGRYRTALSLAIGR